MISAPLMLLGPKSARFRHVTYTGGWRSHLSARASLKARQRVPQSLQGFHWDL